MSRKLKFIEKLTEEQKSSLQKGYTFGSSPYFRRKCHCILMSHAGHNVYELSKLFSVTDQTIRSWLSQWEKKGIMGLELQPGRGRKLKLKTDELTHVEKVKQLVENEPQNLNQVRQQLAEQLDIELSKRTLQRFLKSLNTDGKDLSED